MTTEVQPHEQDVVRLFQSAGYDVEQAVGAELGTIEWYAVQRSGMIRTRTLWRIWDGIPDDFEGALAAIERKRLESGADRALAVLVEGALPEPYQTELYGRTTNAITYRRLSLEMLGLAEIVRGYVRRDERGAMHYLPRRARNAAGETVDPVAYISEWVQSDRPGELTIVGPEESGRTTVLDRVRHELGQKFIAEPERVRPLIKLTGLISHAVALGGLTAAYSETSTAFAAKRQHTIFRNAAFSEAPEIGQVEALDLLPVKEEEIDRWYREQLPSETSYRFSAMMQLAGFSALARAIPNLLPTLRAMQSVDPLAGSTGNFEWLARVLAHYVDDVLQTEGGAARSPEAQASLEHLAFQQFALEQDALPFRGIRRFARRNPALLSWLQVKHQATTTEVRARITNDLIWHFLLARRVASAFREEDSGIFARYQFPKEYVLMFLSVLAPDVAAQISSDRGEQLRAEIERQVERRVQLTLGHLLNRSVGNIRINLDAIREGMRPEELALFATELQRIDRELIHQASLADRTRRWHDVPSEPRRSLLLNDVVTEAVGPLKAAFPRITCELAVDAEIRVHSGPGVLREIFHCLIENAFHAAHTRQRGSGRVEVRASIAGEVIRVHVIDDGDGIHPDDRERIFNPYVTTKKGGDDQPLGTGLGLSIARRYAESIGARVGVDTARPETCFFVDLALWRDAS